MKSLNIVGLGAASGYGLGVSKLMGGLKSGASSVARHRCPGGSFPDNSWFARVPVERDEEGHLSRYSACVGSVIDEAVEDARIRGWKPGRKVAIIHGSAWNDLESMKVLLDHPTEHMRRAYIGYLPTTPLAIAAAKHGINGPVFTINGACATGLCALMLAQRLMACGDATDVIACGTEVGAPAPILDGLHQLGVLQTDRPAADMGQPLSADSKGFLYGEAASAVVLTNEHFDSRYMQLVSSVFAHDGYHPISIEPTHVQIDEAMSDALERAKLSADQIRTFVPHGTGTRQCNDADLHMLRQLPGVSRVVAPKPFVGHSRAAASLLETIVMASSIGDGRSVEHAPAPVYLDHLDLAEPADQSFPCLHMSLGAGGSIGVAIYQR
ncbi:MAG: beta-ketoacyl synthase N-terminal-like domain-containing protein [Stappiaceae bacterium]